MLFEESQLDIPVEQFTFSSAGSNQIFADDNEFPQLEIQQADSNDNDKYVLTTKIDQLKIVSNKQQCSNIEAFKYYQIEEFINMNFDDGRTIANNHNDLINKQQDPFDRIFYSSQPKRQQKSNKNFLKFFFPKFFMRLNETMTPDDAWCMFNKQFQNDKKTSTIQILAKLFQGDDDEYGHKRRNRCFTHKMLQSRIFFQEYLFNSHYIKSKKSRKQYLLAAKIFSVRCRSRQLAGRIQTK